MLKIQNKMLQEEAEFGFWKIWEEQMDLQFFEVKSYDEIDDNELIALKQVGKI